MEYVPSANAGDVVDEQFQFLRSHFKVCASPTCVLCTRWMGVCGLLLIPYEGVTKSPPSWEVFCDHLKSRTLSASVQGLGQTTI